jgi:hypothetical protein
MAPRWFIRLTTADGRQLYWCKGGQRHTLSPELGPHWVANFKPALFQALPDGAIVPRGAQPGAADIAAVALEAVPEPGPAQPG